METTGKIWIFFDAVEKRKSQPMTTLHAQAYLLGLRESDPRKIFLWTPGWPKWESVKNFLKTEQTYFQWGPPPGTPEISLSKSVRALPQPKDADSEQTLTTFEDERTMTVDIHATPFTVDENPISPFTEIVEESTQSRIARMGAGQAYYSQDFSIENVDPYAGNKLKINMGSSSPSEKRIGERHEFKIEVLLVSQSGRSFRSYSENISVSGTLLAHELPKDFLNQRFDLVLVNKFETNPVAQRLRFQGNVVGDFMNPRRLMFTDPDPSMRKRLENMLKAYVQKQHEVTRPKSG